MKCQLLKIETPHNQTPHNHTLTEDQKIFFLIKKRIMDGRKKLTITNKHRMKNTQDGNEIRKSNANIHFNK